MRNVSSSIPHQSVENVVSQNEQGNLEEGEIPEDDLALDSCVDSEGFVMPVDPPLASQGPHPTPRRAGTTHHNLPEVPPRSPQSPLTPRFLFCLLLLPPRLTLLTKWSFWRKVIPP